MPLIAREGLTYIVPAAVVAGAVAHFVGLGWSAPLWALTVALIVLFRDPHRDIPSQPLAVLSPVDGEVMTAEPVRDPYLEREAVCVSIRMRPYGVFTARVPMEGRVAQRWYSASVAGGGGLRTAARPRYGLWIKTDEDDDIVVVMSSGALGSRPRCYVEYGERVGQGQRCGFIRFGSLVDLLLPSYTRLAVAPGDRVSAGTTVLGKLVHK